MIAAVKQVYDIIDMAQEYFPDLIKRRGQYVACCKHGEKTPSLTFWPEQQKFFCFGCKEGGDQIDFFMFVHGIPDFHEALKAMADAKGITWKGEERKQSHVANKERVKEAQSKLEPFEFYLKERGLTDKTIKEFQLGYSDKEHSITIPLQDNRGNVIAFARRMLDENADPKYKNSTNSEDYNKSKFLFNAHRARRHVDKTLYIVEGYFHSMILWQMGVPENVALCTNRMTVDQAFVIRELVKEDTNIVWIPDIDLNRRGQMGCLDSIDILRKALPKNKFYCVVLPYRQKDGMPISNDVADHYTEYGTEGEKRLKAELAKLRPIEFFQAMMVAESNTPQQVQYSEIQQICRSIDNPLVREEIATMLAARWEKPVKTVFEYMGVSSGSIHGIESVKSIQQVSTELTEKITRGHEGLKIGYHKMDLAIGGWMETELLTICMKSSTGKSATMQNIIKKIHMGKRVNGLVFTLETSASIFLQRQAQISYGMTKEAVRGAYRKEESRLPLEARLKKDYENLYIVDASGMGVEDIASITSYVNLNIFPVHVVYVDYAGLMRAPGKDQYHITNHIWNGLQAFGKDFGVRLCVLHQTNNTVQMGKKFDERGIRDSGVIFERSNYVLIGWRESQAMDCSKVRLEEIKNGSSDFSFEIIKNKDGPLVFSVYKYEAPFLQVYDESDYELTEGWQ